jgi:hypothetical protein
MKACQEYVAGRFALQDNTAMKNRYCRRTKISEEAFTLLLTNFCVGATVSDTAVLFQYRHMKLSRQSIEKKYQELGNYYYRKHVLPSYLKRLKKRNPTVVRSDDEWEQWWLDILWKLMRGELDYAAFRRDGLPYPGPETFVKYLQDRWRRTNGFPRETFTSQLGQVCVYLIDAVHVRPDLVVDWFKTKLEKDPL